METINRGGGQLEQRLPCCRLCAGERGWGAVPVLFLVMLSKADLLPCPHVVLASSKDVLKKKKCAKRAPLAFNTSLS